MRYRAEIDGLRALAVIPVILYHAGFTWLPGGFVGVDIFFVISGYLITSILMSELDNSKFSIIKFYERRARRILPALFVVMAVTIPFAYTYLLPNDMANFWKSILSVCFFVSNYLFASLTGYFSPNVDLMPLLHTWSLAVEEQFYIFFPIILYCLWRMGMRAIIFTLAIIAVVSFFYADSGSISDPTFTFYSITTRCWELILGAFGAIYFRTGWNLHGSKIIANLCGISGLLLIVFSMLYLTNTTPFPGRYALIPTAGALLVILFSSENNLPGRILSIRPLVGIGLISYSAYLWHQPLMAILRHKSVTEPSVISMIVVIMCTILIAFLSWRFVEKPFRSKEGFTRQHIFIYAGVGGLFFISIGVAGLKTPYLNRFENSEVYDSTIYRLRGNYGLSQSCEKSFLHSEECRTSANPEILLWGDSYASQLVGLITESKPDVKMIQATISQCAPIVGASYANVIFGAKQCIQANDKTLNLIKSTPSIKYVVLASPFESLSINGAILLRDGTLINKGRDEYIKLFKKTIDDIVKLGRVPVVIAPPVKNQNNDIGYCLLKKSLLKQSLSYCDFSVDDMPDIQRGVYKIMGEIRKSAKVLWLGQLTCHDNKCLASEEGVFFYRDKGHLSFEGSQYLGKKYNFYNMIVN